MDTVGVLTKGNGRIVTNAISIEKRVAIIASHEVVVKERDEPRPVGRPPYFSTVEELDEAIERYFDEADAKKWPYTIPDLAYALGFTSRQSLLNYSKKSIFMDTIKRAKLRIEGQRARQLVQGHGMVAGHIFDLKNNFGWRDQQDLAEEREERVIVQNSVGLVNMPPQPRDLAEWEEWHIKMTESQQGEVDQKNNVDFIELGAIDK